VEWRSTAAGPLQSEHAGRKAAEREVHKRLELAKTDPGQNRCETFWLSSEEVQRWLGERVLIDVPIRDRYAQLFGEPKVAS
jgi:hypothetical protein